MAENEKQRFRAKPQIQAENIKESDLLIMEHQPNHQTEDADYSLRMDQARKFFSAMEKLRAEEAEELLKSFIDLINSKIPSAASETNKLADIQYVNESIQTNTAVNRGDFATYAELEAYEGPVTRNDYATVRDDETHDHECWRYKWNDEEEAWKPEYRINESPMTQAQLAAINSGISASLVESMNDDIVALENTCMRLDTRIDDVKDDVDENRDNIRSLSETIEDIDEKAIRAKGQITSGDLNDYKTAGMWRTVNEAVLNRPADMAASYGQLLVISGDDDNFPTQIYSVEGDDEDAGGNMYYRKWDGDGWTSWFKILTPNNFQFNKSTGTLTIYI